MKKAKDWLTGKTINVAAGAAAENAADLTEASRFRKVAKLANKIPGLKHVPMIGTAIEGTMLATDIITGDDRGLWEDIGGDMAGREVGEWLYDAFSDDEDVNRVESLVDSSNDTTATSLPTAPMIQIEFSPQITVEITGASEEQAQVLSDGIVVALRNMTPELQQQLHDAMTDIMRSSDYLQH